MALQSYSELKAAIASWINRDDLTTEIETFIALAETEIAKHLRTQTAVATLSLDADASSIFLPDDTAEVRSIRYTNPRKGALHLVPGADLPRSDASGAPMFAAVVNASLVFERPASEALDIEITYYTTLPRLSDAEPTNATFSSAPDLYLFGALAEASVFLEHDERASMWRGRFNEALAGLRMQHEDVELRAAASAPRRLPVVFG